jgi:hypothetical protein
LSDGTLACIQQKQQAYVLMKCQLGATVKPAAQLRDEKRSR